MIARMAGLFATMVVLWSDGAAAQTRKPPLPPGVDAGGVAIAILSTGIDYTQPEIAQRLARDGEGQLIGWDFVDGDNRPYNAQAAETPPAWGGDGNALARGIGRPGRRLVPVRIDPNDPVSLAKAAAFVSATPARIAVLPMWTRNADAWAALGMAIKAFPNILFIVAAGDEGRDLDKEPTWPAAWGHANVLVVTAPAAPGKPAETRPNFGAATVAAIVEGRGEALAAPENSRLAAVVAADALAGCWPQLLQRSAGESLKAALLAEADKARPGTPKPVIARCPDGAASR